MVATLKEALVPAPLWKRAFAYVIDSFVVAFVIGLPLNSTLKIDSGSFKQTFDFFTANPDIATKFVFVSLITALLAILYWAIFEYKYKQSLGKYVMKVEVRSTIKEFTFGQCFMRNLSKINTLFLVIDSLNIIFGKSHQRYLEKISNTEVVELGWKI